MKRIPLTIQELYYDQERLNEGTLKLKSALQVKEINPRNGKVKELTDGSEPVRALSPGIDGSIFIAYQNNKVSV